MKILAIILSIYLMALTSNPCDDKADMKELAGISIISEGHHHEADTCSPFCTCQCCQAHVNLSHCPGLSCFKEMVISHHNYLLNHTSAELSGFLIPPERS